VRSIFIHHKRGGRRAQTAAAVLIEGIIEWGVDTVFGLPLAERLHDDVNPIARQARVDSLPR
jgi:hypothetical protein